MIIANLVREARKRAGLTQHALAARAGVAQSTVARIESGTRTPSAIMVERLVRAAGFEVRVGLGEPDPETCSLFERTLRRTPAERLADAARAARFVQRGRAAIRAARSPATHGRAVTRGRAVTHGRAVTDGDFDPQGILDALLDAGVHFVLIGGMAAILHGDAGVTMDIDITPALDAENLDRLAGALRALDARIRADGVPGGLPFDCSDGFLRNLGPAAIINLTTRAGAIDLAFTPAGTRGFEDLRRDAVAMTASGGPVLVASLADVIRSKCAADRDKDRRALPRLRELLARTRRPAS